ncbi:MAG: RNA-binding domain-containing protein [Lentinula lateritia]|uniref:RRM domain-containing protein n=1 Tax=Lentinula lateritia TaxID=40482 RepID=A0ABQ8V991_9AGAR|nr:MAG: RNA-binding domain-containing protein [Lentinula lateritia]KAJ4481797.1 hypothetical protein C8R41DRAFT_471179 [Lentinula lateritia]
MDNAWQPQDNDPSNSADGISIPTRDVGPADYSNGNGAPPRSSRSRSPGDRGRSGGEGGGDGDNPGNNLHVSGLSSKTDSRDLEAAFAKIGRVSKASVVYDPHTRESRLFGFVTMETAEEADAAITALNATELMGKIMTVVRARRGRARTPTPGKYHGPSKRRDRERPYDPRPYDSRYARDYDDRRGSRSSRYDDRGSSRRDYRDDRDRDRDRYRDRDYERYDRDYDRYDRDRYERPSRYDDRDRDRRY